MAAAARREGKEGGRGVGVGVGVVAAVVMKAGVAGASRRSVRTTALSG